MREPNLIHWFMQNPNMNRVEIRDIHGVRMEST